MVTMHPVRLSEQQQRAGLRALEFVDDVGIRLYWLAVVVSAERKIVSIAIDFVGTINRRRLSMRTVWEAVGGAVDFDFPDSLGQAPHGQRGEQRMPDCRNPMLRCVRKCCASRGMIVLVSYGAEDFPEDEKINDKVLTLGMRIAKYLDPLEDVALPANFSTAA